MKFLVIIALLLVNSNAFALDPFIKRCQDLYHQFLQVEMRPYGPHLSLRAQQYGLRDFSKITELKVGQYNVDNMANSRGKWGFDNAGNRVLIKPPSTKPEVRWESLKDVIQRSDDDLLFLEEVEDMDAVLYFIKHRLDGKYRPIMIRGNDERGIDIAILIKKDLPFDLEVQSHKNFPLNQKPIFSRDLLEVELRKAGAKETENPLAVFVATHNKSQRDSPGDLNSTMKRTQQVEASMDIIQSYQNSHPTIPLFFLGDFNADLRSAPDFQQIWKMGFKDSFDLTPNSLPLDQRITQSYFPKNKKAIHSQLDGILVNKAGQKLDLIKSADIIPYKKPSGVNRKIPKSRSKINKQGSDHRKIRVVIDFKKLVDAQKP